MNEKISAETQGKHYEVDVRMISPLNRAGGNVRKDYGDIDELAQSIENQGIRVPIRAFRDKDNEGKWIAIDGHRRLMASMKLVNEKGSVIRAKVIVVDYRKMSDEQLIYDMVVTNSGKPLSPIELSEAVCRLISYGHKPKDIAGNFGKNIIFVKNLELLGAAPKRIRDLVQENKISYSLVLDLLKYSADFNEATAKIEAALIEVETGKTKKKCKITRSAIESPTNRINSYIELQRAMKEVSLENIHTTQINAYYLLEKIIGNRISKSEIINYLKTKNNE